MRGIFALVYVLILASGVAGFVLSIWLQRYEYRTVAEDPREDVYVLQHDRWTGRDCIAFSNAATWAHSDVEACEVLIAMPADRMP